MKKILALLTLLILSLVISIFLITKNRNKKIYNFSEISCAFDGTVKVNLDNNIYECNLKHTPEQINVLEITNPKELEGLTFTWEQEKCTVIWKELNCELNKEFLPQSSFAEAIILVLNSISDRNSLNFESGNSEESIFTGDIPIGKFKIKVGKDGTIKNVYIPDINLEAELSAAK